MENIDLGIEISEDVIKTETPDKIERYDLVPPKEVVKEEKQTNNPFSGYRPGMGEYWIGGDENA